MEKERIAYLVSYVVITGNGTKLKTKIKQFTGRSEKCIPKRIRECPSFKIIETSKL
jgi:hypothetical protein